MPGATASAETLRGLAEVRAEHALQMRLVDALREALQGGRGRSAVDAILRELIDYTNAHFMAEQLLMRLHSYPDYDAHVQEHDRLAGELFTLQQAVEEGQMPPAAELADAVQRWLAAHIEGMDRALEEYLRPEP